MPRFAPELVPMEDKKCRRFEKGLHSPVKRLVMSNRVGKFSEIVECARGLELIKDEMRGTKAWDPRQPAMSLSSSLGSYGSQGPKRQTVSVSTESVELSSTYFFWGRGKFG